MDKLNIIAKQLAAIWKRIHFNQRISIVLVAVVAVVGLWVFARVSHRPSMAMLYPQALDPADAAEIADMLRDEGITFEARNGGRRIYVPSHQVNEARLMMAGAGLPAGSGGTGWGDIFDQGGLGGSSETEINIGKLRALQGELARTISSLASVQSARVHLVLPKDRLFKQDQEPVTASILLNLRPGYDLGPLEVNGIRYLCSSAIQGLATHKIAIVDNSGRTLAKPRDDDSASGLGPDQLAMVRQVAGDYENKINAQLGPVIGASNYTATVTPELTTESSMTEENELTEGVTRAKTSQKTSDATKPRPGGPPGTDSNIDEPTVAAGGAGRTSEKTTMAEYEPIPSTKTTKTQKRPGEIKRITAAVILNKDREDQTFTRDDCEKLVKTIIGYDETRGDIVSVIESSFVQVEAVEEPALKAPSPVMTAIAKHGPAAIISVALLGFLWVVMKKAKFADHVPSLGTAPLAAVGVAGEAGGGGGGEEIRMPSLPGEATSDKKVQEIFNDIEVEEGEAELRGLRSAMAQLADQKPETVAAVIREWIR